MTLIEDFLASPAISYTQDGTDIGPLVTSGPFTKSVSESLSFSKDAEMNAIFVIGKEVAFSAPTITVNDSIAIWGELTVNSTLNTFDCTVRNVGTINLLGSTNFDSVIWASDTAGTFAFGSDSALNITPSSNGKTLVKCTTVTGTITLDVEDGVQNGDTFLIEATDNQLIINSGEWEATPSTSGNITTYTLARVQPALPVSLKKKLRKKLALMLATLKKKRKYYCEVESLTSDGTQYIDTGVIPNEAVSYSWEIYAQAVDTSVNDYHWFIGTQTPWQMAGTYPDVNSPYTFYPGGGDYYQDGVKVSTPSGGNKYAIVQHINSFIGSSSNSTSITLFARRASNGGVSAAGSKRIFCCKISKNNVLIRDFIPVLGWDGKGYMYDKISGRLFGNAGTGDFVVGRQIHPVEYIEATNSGIIEYAVGNYRLTDTTDWEITFTASAPSNNWVMGQPTWIGVHYRKDTTTGNLPRVGIANGSTAGTQCYVDYTDDEKITLALKGTDVYANGVKVGSITRVSAPATQTKYGIFAYKDINQDLPNLRIKNARIYRLKIWDDGVLVQDLIPAIDENGIGGFFENVNRTFIDKESNSTSDFKYPAREVEYLESTGGQYIDTGYVPNNNSVVEYDFEPLSITTNRFMFGVWGNTSTQGRMYIYTGSGGNDPTQYGFGVGAGSMGVNYNNSNVQMSLQRHLCVMDRTSLTYDGTALITGLSGNMTGNTAKFWIGKCNDLNGRDTNPTKIYGCKITDDGTLVRDFIPCFKDGVACMVDKLTGTAYTNQGTGTFTAGRIIEPEYE